MFGVRLSLAQRIALFLVFSTVVAAGTFWLQPRISATDGWGYLFAFLINGTSAATVVIPTVGFAAVLVLAKELNPLFLGVAAGAGGVIGESTAYWMGATCKIALQDTRCERFVSRHMARFGGAIIFGSALIPFVPVDVAGLAAGMTSYPIRRFLLYLSFGKIPMTIAVVYIAAQAFDWAEPWLDRI